MRKLFCKIFGHYWKKVVYSNNDYDVWICPICKEKLIKIKPKYNDEVY